jgi:phosphatidylglycerophosphate synthase
MLRIRRLTAVMTTETPNRRPLKSRDTRWAKNAAAAMARAGISPNAISGASVVAAAIAALATLFASGAESRPAAIAGFVVAALGVQGRLLANLLDGMVAVEWNRRSAAGEVWNDLPDRIADSVILIAAGYAAGAPALGWACALLAVSTAYVRVLGGAVGLPQSFAGPMAKPHRMAVVTVALFASAVETAFGFAPRALVIALWVIAAGTIVTIVRRTLAIVRALESR